MDVVGRFEIRVKCSNQLISRSSISQKQSSWATLSYGTQQEGTIQRLVFKESAERWLS